MTKYKPKTWMKLKALVKDNRIKLSSIDTSEIDDMTSIFANSTRKDFTGIETWDTSNVINMSNMFYRCENFNQPLDKWDVSNVEDMNGMFNCCTKFNQPLNNWDVSSVKNMECMFYRCENFNQPLDKWDVSNVEDMSDMFHNCENFNQNLESWIKSNENFAKEYGDRFNKANT